jgi:hypothetical protein
VHGLQAVPGNVGSWLAGAETHDDFAHQEWFFDAIKEDKAMNTLFKGKGGAGYPSTTGNPSGGGRDNGPRGK